MDSTIIACIDPGRIMKKRRGATEVLPVGYFGLGGTPKGYQENSEEENSEAPKSNCTKGSGLFKNREGRRNIMFEIRSHQKVIDIDS